MPSKRKYLVKKVAAEGEDTKVDAEKLDSVLAKLVQTPPRTNKDVIRIAASRPKPKD